MTAYSLPSISIIVGTFAVTVYSEFAGLTPPTIQTIKVLGDTPEVGDRDLGVLESATMTIELRDDLSTYTQGFWFKVLQGETRIRFYLNEGGTDKFYFVGKPQEESTDWSELMIVDGVRYRTATVTLTSLAVALMDTPTVDWVTEIRFHGTRTQDNFPTAIWTVVSIQDIFASLLKASTINPSFDSTDVSFVYDEQDIVYKVGATPYEASEFFIPLTTADGIGATAYTEYFANAVPLSAGKDWPTNFATAGELLNHLLFNFSFGLRMDYDTATERHLMKLVQRGRAYADANNLAFSNRDKISNIQKATALYGDAVKVLEFADDGTLGRYVWRSKRYTDQFFIAETGDATEAPNYVTFDIDKIIVFDCKPNTFSTSHGIYALTGVDTYTAVDGLEYWNYSDDSYDAPASASDLAETLCGYYFFRFTTKFSQVTQTYGEMTADDGGGESFTNLTIYRRTVFNLDGAGNVTYYANRVTKKPMSAECEIQWIEE